jgi:hypothetical protein
MTAAGRTGITPHIRGMLPRLARPVQPSICERRSR